MTVTGSLIAGGVLALIGVVAVLRGGHRRARRAARAAGQAVASVSLFGRVAVVAAGITGVQFAVIRYSHNLPLLIVALAIPALLAAVALVRALTLSPTVFTDHRRGYRR